LHGNIARIEVLKEDIRRLLEFRNDITKKFKDMGFDFVTVDMEGYRTGSMNEKITKR
jgi:uncharacterized protein